MKKMLTLLVALCFTMAAWAQAPEAKATEGYQFTDVKVIETTPVKNQNRSGTCWCYSTMTFLEAEILRAGGEAVHLSEMFAVRHAYMKKEIGRAHV